MAKIVIAWELGGGVGHLTRVAPLAKALREAGHQVLMVARDLPAASVFMRRIGVSCVQSPLQHGQPPQKLTSNFAHVLASIGYGDILVLRALASAWRTLLRMADPDLLICDHAPTAMLAARGLRCRSVVIGSGFCIPPDVSPLPDFEVVKGIQGLDLAMKEEEVVLANINRVLSEWSEPRLERVGQLYSETAEQFLATYPELDHYPDRPSGSIYWGPINGVETGQKPPEWPEGRGPSIYAYLKPFPALEGLLGYLAASELPTLIYSRDIDSSIRKTFTSRTLRFETELLNLHAVSEQCQLAITHATLSTTSLFLAKGKPVIGIPLVLEQLLLANRISKLGVGVAGSAVDSKQLVRSLQHVLHDLPKIGEAARSLANRINEIDVAQRLSTLKQRICEHAEQGESRRQNEHKAETSASSQPRSTTKPTGDVFDASDPALRIHPGKHVPVDQIAKPRVVLMIRRSKDYWLAGKVDPADVLRPADATLARTAIAWWNLTFRTSYSQYRNRIREIASSIHQRAGFDKIIPWTDFEALEKQEPGTWIVPIDEDDWIDPELGRFLANAFADTTANIATWDVMRRDATGNTSMNSGTFIESCGYAVRLPFPVAAIENHMELGPAVAIHAENRSIRFDRILAVKNETPGSLGYFARNGHECLSDAISASLTRSLDSIPDQYRSSLAAYQAILEGLSKEATEDMKPLY